MPLLASSAGHMVAFAQMTHAAASPLASGVGREPARSAMYNMMAPDSKIPVPSAALHPGILPKGCTERYSGEDMIARFRFTFLMSWPTSSASHSTICVRLPGLP